MIYSVKRFSIAGGVLGGLGGGIVGGLLGDKISKNKGDKSYSKEKHLMILKDELSNEKKNLADIENLKRTNPKKYKELMDEGLELEVDPKDTKEYIKRLEETIKKVESSDDDYGKKVYHDRYNKTRGIVGGTLAGALAGSMLGGSIPFKKAIK